MKIAVSSEGKDLNSLVDPRFGRAKGFILYDLESGKSEYVDNRQNLQSSQGAGIQAAKNVINAGAKTVITGNIGPKAHATLNSAGIDIFMCGQTTIRESIEDYREGKLEKSSGANVEGHW